MAKRFTLKEWRLLDRNKNPLDVKELLDSMSYKENGAPRNFREILKAVETKKQESVELNPLEVVLLAAGYLSCRGFRSDIVNLRTYDGRDLPVYVYKDIHKYDGKYGAIALPNPEKSILHLLPRFRTPKGVVKKCRQIYRLDGYKILGYKFIDLDGEKLTGWRFNKKGSRKVKKKIEEARHIPLNGNGFH